jgi:multidrug efflux pump subunit AcrB
MKYEISYDVSFLDASIEQVCTRWRGLSWCPLVVFLFLGDWRSTLIPSARRARVADRRLRVHAAVRPHRST